MQYFPLKKELTDIEVHQIIFELFIQHLKVNKTYVKWYSQFTTKRNQENWIKSTTF